MSQRRALVDPVAITGMHRSGTSMITRGLHESGLHLIGGDADALLAAADDNPEGFWENKAIVACNDDLLEATGGSWDNPPALLPQAVDDPRVAAVVEPATAALAGLRENRRWGFKDPRLCLTAAFWLDLQPDLRFVICVRNPLEVALSLKRRNQNSYSLGLALWERYYASILDLVPPERRVVTHYDTYFFDPVGELGRVCDFVGLEAAAPNVRRDLRHHDVGVSLEEANLSAGIRTLYQRLCNEAGAPAPRPAVVDEGQVRRLVLDGTVAARHAEQRQLAIDRLEERLGESRQLEEQLKIELARVRREAELARVRHEADRVRHEADLAAATAAATDRFDALLAGQEALRAQSRDLIDTTDTIVDMAGAITSANQQTNDRLAHLEAITGAIHVKLRHVEDTVTAGFFSSLKRRVRRLSGRGRRAAGAGARRGIPVAKASAKRMPTSVQIELRRVRRAVNDGQARKRVEERVKKVVGQLPAPAREAARQSATAVQKSGAVPRATRTVRRIGRRLPAPAKDAIRRYVSATPAPSERVVRPVKKAAAAPRPKRTDDGRRVDVPKGPAAFKWQKGYERLVSEFVGTESSWAAITPGSSATVHTVGERNATRFPSEDGEAPAADSQSLIAVLEALRLAGCERLVLPEGSRRWFQQHPELRDHVARSHVTLVDRASAGAVFDLTASAALPHRGLLAEVKELANELEATPAVLDWTGLGISGELPGFTTFEPPGVDSLPYFDQSIEIVVTTTDRDGAEAARVASVAVITVVVARDALVVSDIAAIKAARTDAPVVVVCAPTPVEAGLEAALVARVEESGATIMFGEAGSIDVDVDVVVVLEPGVLPLPGSISALAAAAHARPDTVAAAKVIDAQGRVESAGGMVFADGSIAGIASGTLEVRAPWHEYVRPVYWGGGMVAASSEIVAAQGVPSAEGFVDWCAEIWAGGRTVGFRPRAAVVRVGSLAPAMRVGDGWTPLLKGRPGRPATFTDGTWRYLLATDDPEALAARDDH